MALSARASYGRGKTILARDAAESGLATLIRAGPLVFTAGCDGHRDPATGAIVPVLAGEAEAQCEIAYGGIERLLEHAGCGPASIVRLDHFTSSQDWLPRRQTIRQQHFGRPAPLASTGVAALMPGLNMLTACAVAVADPAQKAVLVPGPQYGMANIASLVRGGPFLFLSGIRGITDPRTGQAVAEETAGALAAQTSLAGAIIGAILGEVGAHAGRIVRLDCYVRDINRAGEVRAALAAALPGSRARATVIGLPLGARGEVELTALAVAADHDEPVRHPAPASVFAAGGLLFVGECRSRHPVPADREGQLQDALDMLEAVLRACGVTLAQTVRIDLYLRDPYFAPRARSILHERCADSPPVVLIAGAYLEDSLEAKLAAIAIDRAALTD